MDLPTLVVECRSFSDDHFQVRLVAFDNNGEARASEEFNFTTFDDYDYVANGLEKFADSINAVVQQQVQSSIR